MIRKILTALSLLLYGTLANAEYKPTVSFESSRTTYDVKADGTYVLTYESTAKIETEKGAKNAGEEDISFNKTNETLEILEAYTLQPDGRKIPVPKSRIRLADDDLSEGTAMFNDLKHKVIIFPDVKVGSRLHHKYRLVAHKVPFKNQFMLSGFYTPHYVIKLDETIINISDKLKLNIDTKAVEGGLVGHSKGVNHYKFTYRQAVAHKSERGQAAISDFAPYVIASTFNNQVEMGQEYQKKLATQVKVTPEVKKLAGQITGGMVDEKDKVHALYNWVTRNIRYVGVYVGNGGFVPHSADSVIHNRYGDCKDHATLFEALLRAIGVDSSAALINSGNAYTLPKYAVSNPIDHVISYIPKYDLYLDTTSEFTRFGVLPKSDMDKPTILTALSQIGHTPKMKPSDYVTEVTVKFIVGNDGSIDGTSKVFPRATNESSFRAKRLSNRDKDDKGVMDTLLASFNETGTGKITSTDPLDLNTPFELSANFKLDPISNVPGPAAINIPVGAQPGALYALASDKPEVIGDFPYACYPEEIHESYEIDFPATVKVTRIPTDKSYSKDNITYHATYKLDGQTVKVIRDFAIEHESMFCRPDQQDITEEFFRFIQSDLRSQIFYE